LSSGVAHGYAITPYKWFLSPVTVYVNPANRDVSASAAEAAVLVGMNAWNGVSSSFRFRYGGRVTDTATAVDGRNVVIFRNATNGGAGATTYGWVKNGARFDSDVVFWDAKYRLYTGSTACLNGLYIEDIAAHELGHVAGLMHSSATSATMYAMYTYCSKTMRTLASDDIAGLRKMYP